MLIDCHTHTYLCKHAQRVAPIAYLHVAKKLGFTHFVFCDHNPFKSDNYDFIHRMSLAELDTFNTLYEQEKLVNQDLPKRLKYMEVDWQPMNHNASLNFVQDHLQSFDCAMCSIHFNEQYEMDLMEKQTVEEFLDFYEKEFLTAVNSNQFQIMCHIDFFKEYNKKVKALIQTEEGLKMINDRLVQIITKAENKVLIEINTCPRKYDAIFKSFPDMNVVKALGNQAKFSIGSDSHQLKDVGQNFREIFTQLLECGVKELYYVENKEMKSYSVEEALSKLHEIDAGEIKEIFQQFKL
ncbi:Histidinol-phosphatase [Hexamita inflata]|uniref:histidinol-phosphatase n=1 Tax=Hexamita inflata TaxID=28002 RepID=A0AA86U0Q7_9EUKA|nr:Histidinol-phosphatase [Hexamita inflata]